MMQAHFPDRCCGKHISKALREGKLDTAESWECPKCGCPWKPRVIEGIRMWEPHPVFQVLR